MQEIGNSRALGKGPIGCLGNEDGRKKLPLGISLCLLHAISSYLRVSKLIICKIEYIVNDLLLLLHGMLLPSLLSLWTLVLLLTVP